MKKTAVRHAMVEAELVNGIAAQVRVIRQQRGMSQKALAQVLGTTQAAVSRLEDPSYGRYSLQTLLAIGKALDIALVVRFVPFTRFLNLTASATRQDLEVEQFDEEIKHVKYYTAIKHSPKEEKISLVETPAVESNIKRLTGGLVGATVFASTVTRSQGFATIRMIEPNEQSTKRFHLDLIP